MYLLSIYLSIYLPIYLSITSFFFWEQKKLNPPPLWKVDLFSEFSQRTDTVSTPPSPFPSPPTLIPQRTGLLMSERCPLRNLLLRERGHNPGTIINSATTKPFVCFNLRSTRQNKNSARGAIGAWRANCLFFFNGWMDRVILKGGRLALRTGHSKRICPWLDGLFKYNDETSASGAISA